MLANSISTPAGVGTPNFTHSYRLDNIFEDVLLETIPEFIHGLRTSTPTKKLNEEDLSQEFVIELNRYLNESSKGIVAHPEYRDIHTEGANPVKRVDIAFLTSVRGASKCKLYTVEAKRLPTGVGTREKEYVYGFSNSGSPSGGIQRFKTGDHGYGLSKSGLLGYVEENEFTHWYNTINGWIVGTAAELSEWSETEQLQQLEVNPTQNCAISRSTASRASDTIDLFHLWVKIPSLEN